MRTTPKAVPAVTSLHQPPLSVRKIGPNLCKPQKFYFLLLGRDRQFWHDLGHVQLNTFHKGLGNKYYHACMYILTSILSIPMIGLQVTSTFLPFMKMVETKPLECEVTWRPHTSLSLCWPWLHRHSLYIATLLAEVMIFCLDPCHSLPDFLQFYSVVPPILYTEAIEVFLKARSLHVFLWKQYSTAHSWKLELLHFPEKTFYNLTFVSLSSFSYSQLFCTTPSLLYQLISNSQPELKNPLLHHSSISAWVTPSHPRLLWCKPIHTLYSRFVVPVMCPHSNLPSSWRSKYTI